MLKMLVYTTDGWEDFEMKKWVILTTDGTLVAATKIVIHVSFYERRLPDSRITDKQDLNVNQFGHYCSVFLKAFF